MVFGRYGNFFLRKMSFYVIGRCLYFRCNVLFLGFYDIFVDKRWMLLFLLFVFNIYLLIFIQVIISKVVEKIQEIEELDLKIKILIKCFFACDKIIGEFVYIDVVMIVEDELKKKMSCRFICQDILVIIVLFEISYFCRYGDFK